MGRLDSLTAWALGRGPYEHEVIETSQPECGHRPRQQYDRSGRPRNAETKRLEKDHVRAANEVMQVTGIVEDSTAAKFKADVSIMNKNQEALTGLRLMEVGRTVLIGGVWGVIGLRRRVLLYKSYSTMTVSEIFRQEIATRSLTHVFFAGIPTVPTCHILEWVSFFAETVAVAIFNKDDDVLENWQLMMKDIIEITFNVGFSYLSLHFRMFGILQQLNLIPASNLLPSLRSFLPFSKASPLQLPPSPSLNVTSLISWGGALLQTVAPMLIIFTYGRVKFMVSQLIYRPIYKTLPRPTGDSMFSGLPMSAPALEYDAPDRDRPTSALAPYRSEDEPTLRALEGRLPSLERTDTRSRRSESGRDSDDDEEEATQATLISFDVEATEAVETNLGTWSAELRSANEPKHPEDIKYRVTGFTMLPPIMAAEGLRDIVTSILLVPLESTMVRLVGRAFRESQGLGVDDMWSVVPLWQSLSFENLLMVFNTNLAITGVIWAGYTVGALWWAEKRLKKLEGDETQECEDHLHELA